MDIKKCEKCAGGLWGYPYSFEENAGELEVQKCNVYQMDFDEINFNECPCFVEN